MSDITFDEFFALKSLLNGSEEDYQIGISNLENLAYNDKKIVDILFIKSLHLKKREKFLKCGGLEDSINYRTNSLLGKVIYTRILKEANKKVYKQILKEIMK
jgi:hypothetical protein